MTKEDDECILSVFGRSLHVHRGLRQGARKERHHLLAAVPRAGGAVCSVLLPHERPPYWHAQRLRAGAVRMLSCHVLLRCNTRSFSWK